MGDKAPKDKEKKKKIDDKKKAPAPPNRPPRRSPPRSDSDEGTTARSRCPATGTPGSRRGLTRGPTPRVDAPPKPSWAAARLRVVRATVNGWPGTTCWASESCEASSSAERARPASPEARQNPAIQSSIRR